MSRRARADRLADADLAGPLADRDQHDVHDPDAAHDRARSTRCRPAAASASRSPTRRCRGSCAWFWIVKSSRADGGEVVAGAGASIDLGARDVHLLGARDADADRADGRAADEVALRGGERDEHLVVGIAEVRRRPSVAGCRSPRTAARGSGSSMPMADAPRPRSSAVVAPRTATRSALFDRDIGQERALPDSRTRGQPGSRASCRSPPSSCSGYPRRSRLDEDSSGSTAATPASARIGRRVVDRQRRRRARGAACAAGELAPGVIVRRFVPSPWSRVVMPDEAPWPTATSAMTEATPMITPSIVSGRSHPADGQSRDREPKQVDAGHATTCPSANADLSRSRRPRRRVVRDQDDRATRRVQLVEQRHHFGAGVAVEVAGGLVGEQQRRVASRGPGRWPRAAAGRRRAPSVHGGGGRRGPAAPGPPGPARVARAGRRPGT